MNARHSADDVARVLQALSRKELHSASPRAGAVASMSAEERWLYALDGLRLECDGMTRVVAALLERDGVWHVPMVGRLEVPDVGRIPLHHWVELADGRRIDLRARMWLGDDPCVPHGIVPADAENVQYEGRPNRLPCSPVAFWALTDRSIDAFDPATFLVSVPSHPAAGERAPSGRSP